MKQDGISYVFFPLFFHFSSNQKHKMQQAWRKVIIVQTDCALILKRELHTCFMSICTQVLCFIKEKHAALLCCCSLLATNIVDKKLLILFLYIIINIHTYEKKIPRRSLWSLKFRLLSRPQKFNEICITVAFLKISNIPNMVLVKGIKRIS